MNPKIAKIRQKEALAHTKMYQSEVLFEGNSWLKKPAKVILDLVPLFAGLPKVRILDLGCGVGRNCIPVAQFLSPKCQIDAVDYLEIAIRELNNNTKKYHIESHIDGIISTIEDFKIEENAYNFIIAVSALEHLATKNQFLRKLHEIKLGTKSEGIVAFIINSEVQELNVDNQTWVAPQFEINLKTEELINILETEYSGWKVLKKTVRPQNYPVQREDYSGKMYTQVVSFVAQNS